MFSDNPLPDQPVGMTLCSGIGAPEMAAPWIDWRLASEIEGFPRAVLAERFGYLTPDDHVQGAPLLWGDMAEVSPDPLRRHGVPLPDILVAGTPCQAFSIAGGRGGLDDPRGNLTLKFVRLCHEIQDQSPRRRLVAVWENVPGVLSMSDNAFGCLLGGIVGGPAIDKPGGKSWPRSGMVAGPRGRAAWRVLDSQYFGVAQRRRRVFLVASLGDGPDPAKILFERGIAGGDIGARADQGEASSAGPSRGPRGVARPVYAIQERAVALNPNSGPDGAGFSGCGVAYTLEARGSVQAIAMRGRDGGASCEVGGHVSNALRASGGGGSLAYLLDAPAAVVRRITPPECHVLQGFPVNHCAIEYRKKPAFDSPQWAALGNSMSVPVMRWILDRARGLSPPITPFDFTASTLAAWPQK